MKTLHFFALGLLFCSAANAQNASPNYNDDEWTHFLERAAHAQEEETKTSSLRTLIISGGPNFNSNQYAIESNARYVEKLTENSRWRRVHFADGKADSRTIAAVQASPDFKVRRVLAWLRDEELPLAPIVAQSSALARIDGASTKARVTDVLGEFARPAAGETGLLYFTGHGSAGGSRARPDYENTTFALWGDDAISEREVASSLRAWPTANPLFVVMVQCHSGGFANLIFEEGDPQKPLLDRDIAGFFSSTGQRMAAGCTPEVNERDYQDFTTHFFAALSGVSRDGRPIKGADFDRDGKVSGSEAFAWANIKDLSIDVPVSTSDAYLRALYGQTDGWQSTPYSQVLANAKPWQKAMLNELSSALQLSGEPRIKTAMAAHSRLLRGADAGVTSVPGVDERAVRAQLAQLRSQVNRRFPDSSEAKSSDKYQVANRGAAQWLASRPAEIALLDDALNKYERTQNAGQVKIAMLERFVRGAYTIVLENKLSREGTPQQQANFARFRAAEARNPLK